MDLLYDPATPDLGKLIYQLATANAKEKVRTVNEIADSIRRISADNNLVQWMMLQLSGRKLDALSIEEILKVEKDLITEVKKRQLKR